MFRSAFNSVSASIWICVALIRCAVDARARYLDWIEFIYFVTIYDRRHNSELVHMHMQRNTQLYYLNFFGAITIKRLMPWYAAVCVHILDAHQFYGFFSPHNSSLFSPLLCRLGPFVVIILLFPRLFVYNKYICGHFSLELGARAHFCRPRRDGWCTCGAFCVISFNNGHCAR